MTSKGLYCPAGNFYIDPKSAVEQAVITHAHSDHARKGSKQYFCVSSGTGLLKVRLGSGINVKSMAYGDSWRFGDVKVSFHPAGHILGSSQVRVEFNNEVWVVSGDYKRDPDPTCEPFETVTCDVFITEATFGTPAYCWGKTTNYGEQISAWWSRNKRRGLNSVLFAYSLGKAQRILGSLVNYASEPVFCHPAVETLNQCYREQGIKLADSIDLNQHKIDDSLSGKLFIVPPSFLKSDESAILGKKYRTAFASGWMVRNSYGYDASFLMSDHADWNDLLRTVEESKAKKVFVQYRGNGALVNELKSRGIEAYSDKQLWPTNPHQLAFL
jgi:putative mRNA 3-end processing factor